MDDSHAPFVARGRRSRACVDAVVSVGGALLAGGCESEAPEWEAPNWPAVYEGPHLRLHADPSSDAPVCLGSAISLDLHTRDVAASLEIPSERPVEAYLGSLEYVGTCEGALGCTIDGVATGEAGVIRHEIVHSIHQRWGTHSDALLAEGLACGLEGPPVQRSDAPSAYVGLSYEEAHPCDVGSPFVRWLLMTRGADDLQSLYVRSDYAAGQASAQLAYRDVFGTTLDELERDYLGSAPLAFPSQDCAELEEIEWRGPRALARADLDCSEATTRGPIPSEAYSHTPSMYAAFRLRIDVAGMYRVRPSPDTIWNVRPCLDRPTWDVELAAMIATFELEEDDLPMESGSAEMRLVPGSYRVIVGSVGLMPRSVLIAVTRPESAAP